MNTFKPNDESLRFDRIVSVEMFEHMRNWEELLTRVSAYLKPSGLVFIHVFAHKTYPYSFDVVDDSDWMSATFFSGGMMPCHDLMSRLKLSTLKEIERWQINGNHYARTLEDWLIKHY